MNLSDFKSKVSASTKRRAELLGQSSWRKEKTELHERHFAVNDIEQLDPQIAAAYRWHMEKGELDLAGLGRLAPDTMVHVVNTGTLNPGGYRVERYDSRATLDDGKDFTGLWVGDYPDPVYSEHLQRSYMTAASLGVPAYSEIWWTSVAHGFRSFARLIVPHTSCNGVDKVTLFVRPKQGKFAKKLADKVRARCGNKINNLRATYRGANLRFEAGVTFRVAVDPSRELLQDATMDGVTDHVVEVRSEDQVTH